MPPPLPPRLPRRTRNVTRLAKRTTREIIANVETVNVNHQAEFLNLFGLVRNSGFKEEKEKFAKSLNIRDSKVIIMGSKCEQCDNWFKSVHDVNHHKHKCLRPILKTKAKVKVNHPKPAKVKKISRKVEPVPATPSIITPSIITPIITLSDDDDDDDIEEILVDTSSKVTPTENGVAPHAEPVFVDMAEHVQEQVWQKVEETANLVPRKKVEGMVSLLPRQKIIMPRRPLQFVKVGSSTQTKLFMPVYQTQRLKPIAGLELNNENRCSVGKTELKKPAEDDECQIVYEDVKKSVEDVSLRFPKGAQPALDKIQDQHVSSTCEENGTVLGNILGPLKENRVNWRIFPQSKTVGKKVLPQDKDKSLLVKVNLFLSSCEQQVEQDKNGERKILLTF